MAPISDLHRTASVIAQSTLNEIILKIQSSHGDYTVGELCRYGDRLLNRQVDKRFKHIKERGIAYPVEICRNEFASGVAPEEQDIFQGGVFIPGDVVKIRLGVHIDGYTVMAGHTIVVEDSNGNVAPNAYVDAIIGASTATQAVISLLACTLSENHFPEVSEVTGSMVRQVVEDVASSFNLMVVPGSKVRQIKRFVVGQQTVRDSLPSVEWGEHQDGDNSAFVAELDSQFSTAPGRTMLIDIQMAPKVEPQGYIKFKEVLSPGTAIEGPSIYTRDHTVVYQLRTNTARNVLNAVDSVYPFKLSYLQLPVNQLKLGVNECVQRHLLVGEPRLKTMFVPELRPKEAIDVVTAREITTIRLVSGKDSGSGYPEVLRMSGGSKIPQTLVQARPGLSQTASALIGAPMTKNEGLRYLETKPLNVANFAKDTGIALETRNDESMDVEM